MDAQQQGGGQEDNRVDAPDPKRTPTISDQASAGRLKMTPEANKSESKSQSSPSATSQLRIYDLLEEMANDPDAKRILELSGKIQMRHETICSVLEEYATKVGEQAARFASQMADLFTGVIENDLNTLSEQTASLKETFKIEQMIDNMKNLCQQLWAGVAAVAAAE